MTALQPALKVNAPAFWTASACARDGKLLAFASLDGLHVIDLTNPKKSPYYLEHKASSKPTCLRWSPFAENAGWLIESFDQRLVLWDIAGTSNYIDAFSYGHNQAVTDLQWSSTEPLLVASTSFDNTVRLWDLRSPRKTTECFRDIRPGFNVRWSPTDANIVASSHSDHLMLWDRRKAPYPLKAFRAHDAKITSIDWSLSGNALVSASQDGSITFWNPNSTIADASMTAAHRMRTRQCVSKIQFTPNGSGLGAATSAWPPRAYIVPNPLHSGPRPKNSESYHMSLEDHFCDFNWCPSDFADQFQMGVLTVNSQFWLSNVIKEYGSSKSELSKMFRQRKSGSDFLEAFRTVEFAERNIINPSLYPQLELSRLSDGWADRVDIRDKSLFPTSQPLVEPVSDAQPTLPHALSEVENEHIQNSFPEAELVPGSLEEHKKHVKTLTPNTGATFTARGVLLRFGTSHESATDDDLLRKDFPESQLQGMFLDDGHDSSDEAQAPARLVMDDSSSSSSEDDVKTPEPMDDILRPRLGESALQVVHTEQIFGSLDAHRALAEGYIVFGDPETVCNTNAAVASNLGLHNIAQTWESIAMILGRNVPLQLTDTGSELMLVEAKRNMVQFKRRNGETEVFFDEPAAVLNPVLKGRVKWGSHPFGGDGPLIQKIIEAYEEKADFQMLAMLSCVLSEAPDSDYIKHGINGLSMASRTPAFSVDYQRSIETFASVSTAPRTDFITADGTLHEHTAYSEWNSRMNTPTPNSHSSVEIEREHERRSHHFAVNEALSQFTSSLTEKADKVPASLHPKPRSTTSDQLLGWLDSLSNDPANLITHTAFPKSGAHVFTSDLPEHTSACSIKYHNQHRFDEEGQHLVPLLPPAAVRRLARYHRVYLEQLHEWGLHIQAAEIGKFDLLLRSTLGTEGEGEPTEPMSPLQKPHTAFSSSTVAKKPFCPICVTRLDGAVVETGLGLVHAGTCFETAFQAGMGVVGDLDTSGDADAEDEDVEPREGQRWRREVSGCVDDEEQVIFRTAANGELLTVGVGRAG